MSPINFGRRDIYLSASGRSDVGRQRQNNEDRFLISALGPPDPEAPPQAGAVAVGSKGILLMVADGMGGAAAGEIASEMATTLIHDRLLARWAVERGSSPRDFAFSLEEAITQANLEIHRRATDDPQLHGMGSTLTAVGVLGEHLVFTQVGDSRAYQVREGKVEQVTKDQSLIGHLVEEGRVTKEEAENMAGSNMILQALGPREEVEVEVTFGKARRGDALVLCTDGLSGVVGADEIRDAVVRSHDPAAVCEDLVELANSRGGPDNITVVVGKLTGPGLRIPRRWD
ncbi:MAG: protein phosphatase 2C domain-containing protein [Gemmatimonadota bacterium]|jgi:protein phosphatase